MLLSEGINLFPDRTVLAQLAIFLVVFFALNRLVFQPVLSILNLRREKTDGDREKIKILEAERDRLLKSYEAKLGEAKREALKEREMIRKEGELVANKMIHQARVESLEQIAAMKEEIAQASQKAREELETKAVSLSKSIGVKVLGRNFQ